MSRAACSWDMPPPSWHNPPLPGLGIVMYVCCGHLRTFTRLIVRRYLRSAIAQKRRRVNVASIALPDLSRSRSLPYRHWARRSWARRNYRDNESDETARFKSPTVGRVGTGLGNLEATFAPRGGMNPSWTEWLRRTSVYVCTFRNLVVASRLRIARAAEECSNFVVAVHMHYMMLWLRNRSLSRPDQPETLKSNRGDVHHSVAWRDRANRIERGAWCVLACPFVVGYISFSLAQRWSRAYRNGLNNHVICTTNRLPCHANGTRAVLCIRILLDIFVESILRFLLNAVSGLRSATIYQCRRV